jgi:arginase
MPDQVIVTPYFLDRRVPQLGRFLGDGELNEPPLTRSEALTGSDQLARLAEIHRPLAQRVSAAVRSGKRPVSLAGDCCTTLGLLAGLQEAGVHPTLVWLDAHGDFNTPETTPSGFIGGMPLAMLVGRGDQTLVAAAGLKPMPESSVYLSDARDLDPGEAEAVRRSGIHHVTDLGELAQRLPEKEPLWVHLDCDLLDPQVAPAMSYPAPGGPSLEQAEAALAELAATGRIVAVSVTAWDFGKDADGRTEHACRRLLAALLAP